jgi:hypothetical protein
MGVTVLRRTESANGSESMDAIKAWITRLAKALESLRKRGQRT